MRARWQIIWESVRDSLWFIPGLFTVAASVLALVMVEGERTGALGMSSLGSHYLFGGGAEGARGVLSAISGGLITVTGVVFSVTIVALQLASSQFTPRVLRNFTADRANQLVLGVFIGTFTYTLLVLRVVQSETAERAAFVPRVSVTLSVVLVLVSIGFLIYFINHSARSIQVSHILKHVTDTALRDVERIFPNRIGHPDPEHFADPRAPGAESAPVRAQTSGYLQAVDGATLFALGEKGEMVIGMEPHIGDFVLEGEALVMISPAAAAGDAAVIEGVRRAFVLGSERTREQDVEFGIIEISDIAVRALSPGINDPTTALLCIDRLTQILLALGSREETRIWRTAEGSVHYVARDSTFERAVHFSFAQTLHFGADNPVIVRSLLRAVARLHSRVTAPRRPVLEGWRDTMLKSAYAAGLGPVELSGPESGFEAPDPAL